MTDLSIPEKALYPKFVGESKIDTIEKKVPRPGPNQLLIRCKANAVCASDLGAYYNGSIIVPGHESAGVVVAAGRNTSIEIETPGIIYLMDFCGGCRSCQKGSTNQCLAKRADYGFSLDGGYGPFELINENVFFPIGSDIDFTEATMLLDIMGTGGHAIKRAQSINDDIQSLLITGAGPIGLGIAAMAHLTFGDKIPVVITDLIPYRLELSEKLGAKPIDASKESLKDGLAKYGLEQVDAAIDPERAREMRESRKPEDEDVCTMCGEFCAIKVLNQEKSWEFYE